MHNNVSKYEHVCLGGSSGDGGGGNTPCEAYA